jgi:hypothetical protein
MKRTPAYHAIDFELDTCLKLEVEGYCEPGYDATMDDPGCNDSVEDLHVYLTAPGKERLEITGYLSDHDIKNIVEDLVYDFCDYDDGDAAYEERAGK